MNWSDVEQKKETVGSRSYLVKFSGSKKELRFGQHFIIDTLSLFILECDI